MRCRALPLKSTSRPKAATLHAFRRYLETSLGHQSQARARDLSSCCHLCRWRRLCDVEWQPCLSGRDSGHERPGECACSSHDGGWPLGRHPCRVARYRLDVRTGVGACSFGSVLHLLPQGAPPALMRPSLTRPKVASMLREEAPESAVAAARGVASPSARLSGTDALRLTFVTN